MVFLKTAIFLVALLALQVTAQGLKCEVKDVQATSVKVKWCESAPVPSDSTVTIEANPVGPVVDGIVSAENVPGCETVLENLCSLQKYQVTVKGGTDQETCEFATDYGDISNIEDSELDVTWVGNTTVRVSWKHARCFRRDNTMFYKIQTDYDGSSTVEDYQAWGDKSVNETYDWYDKTGLDQETEYRFTFSTCKRSGNMCSRDHVEKITTKLEVPNPPENLVLKLLESDAFEISWEEPSGTTKFDGYRVTVGDKTVDLDKNETKYLVQGLRPNYQFKVQVVTVYKNVTSVPLSMTVRTKEKMLKPPKNLKFISLKSNVIEISWEKPSDTTIIEGYRVNVGDKTGVLPWYKTTFRAEDLKPNTQYKVEVVAFYRELTSVPLSTTAWTKMLNPPQNLIFTSLERNSFGISWERPSDTFNVDGYRVTVANRIDNLPQHMTTFYVSDLKPNTQYKVQVVAYYKEFTSLPLSATVWTKENGVSPSKLRRKSSWISFSFQSFSQESVPETNEVESDRRLKQ